MDKSRYPELQEATTTAYATWLGAARELVPRGGEAAATDLAIAVLTVAHGHAALLADGQFGAPTERVDDVAERAAAATRALLRGRTVLTGAWRPH